jgi:hypothetical protein
MGSSAPGPSRLNRAIVLNYDRTDLSTRSLRADLLLALALIALCVAARLLPHVQNFSPVAAAALFAGAVMGRRTLAVLMPLAAMLIGDLVLGFYHWQVMATVYAALAVPALIGMIGRRHGLWLTAIGGAIGSALIFFATTNFAVWAFSGMYSLDGAGLLQCYIAGLPYLKYTVVGDLLWSVALFASLTWLGAAAKPTRGALSAAP